jgi:hypothetical protein
VVEAARKAEQKQANGKREFVSSGTVGGGGATLPKRALPGGHIRQDGVSIERGSLDEWALLRGQSTRWFPNVMNNETGFEPHCAPSDVDADEGLWVGGWWAQRRP